MGTLYLVATPIGHLEDITLRALRLLGEVGVIAAEDTRHTRTLLHHYQIRTPLISYHEHNKLTRLGEILKRLEGTDVALVSDAGTPGLSDPGYELVRAALEAGYEVTPVPGPSAPIAALVASGLPTDSFVFLGYLPRRAGERRALLQSLSGEKRTLVAFEVPHRLAASLEDLRSALGEDRPVVVAREMTKLHEGLFRGTLDAASRHFASEPVRGEITLVLAGAKDAAPWPKARVREALAGRLREGQAPSEAARQVAVLSGWTRRQVYRLALELR